MLQSHHICTTEFYLKKEIRWCGANSREQNGCVEQAQGRLNCISVISGVKGASLFLLEALSMIPLTCRHYWCLSLQSGRANWWGIGNDMDNMLNYEETGHMELWTCVKTTVVRGCVWTNVFFQESCTARRINVRESTALRFDTADVSLWTPLTPASH